MLRSYRAFFILPILALLTLTLAACQTGRGYNTSSRNWDYTSRKPAEQPPRSLADIQREAFEQAQKTDNNTGINTQTDDAYTFNSGAPTAAALGNNIRPVKVGILLPLSGRHKELGEAMLKAAQIALFDIGFTNFKLIPQDTQGTTQGAANAARAALQENAELILGPLFADSVRAAKPITANARINMIAFSTDWTLAGGNTFMMGFLPFDQVDRLTRYIAARNIGRVGIITPDTTYGNTVSSAYTNAAARYGIRTSARKIYPANTSNISPILREFTQYDTRQNAAQSPATKPFDAVLMPVGGEQASAIGNLLSHYDLPPRDVKRLGTGLFDDKSLAMESNMEGAWFAAPSPDLRRNFEEKYLAIYARSAPRLATLAYDATALAAVLAMRGIQQNGQPAFDRNNITNPNGFAGIDGIFRFRRDGTVERGLAILEFRNGRIVVIDPAPSTFQAQNF